jgi:hypothetical protein
MKARGRAVKESITSGQSGDCLVYSLRVIYTFEPVHRPWSVHHITDHKMTPYLIIQQEPLFHVVSFLISQLACATPKTRWGLHGSHWSVRGASWPVRENCPRSLGK